MDTKILWAAIALLFLVSFYNTYNSHLQNEEINKLSEHISLLNPVLGSNITQGRPNLFVTDRSIPIVAVTRDGDGVVGNLTVKLIPGNNNVLVNTNPFIDTRMQQSANIAVTVAKLRSNYGFDRDFLFDYQAGSTNLIGGGSAGAATTIAVIAALQNATIRKDVAITGTIEADGTIGNVGSILEKAKAVADAGYKRFLVPAGESNVTFYERQIYDAPTHQGLTIHKARYVRKTIDLNETARKDWNLEIIETPTIDDALKYMIQ